MTLFLIIFFAVMLFAIGVIIHDIYESWGGFVDWCKSAGLILLFVVLFMAFVVAVVYGFYVLPEHRSHVVVPTWALLVLVISIGGAIQHLYERAVHAERKRDELQRQLESLRAKYDPPADFGMWTKDMGDERSSTSDS